MGIKTTSWGRGADGGRMGGDGGSDGEKGEEVLLAGLAAFGWPLVLGVNIGRRASHATHRHRTVEEAYEIIEDHGGNNRNNYYRYHNEIELVHTATVGLQKYQERLSRVH